MATKLEEILGKDINSLKELREEIKRLQDSIAGADTETQEFADTSAKLRAAQEQLTAVTKAGKEENNAAADSIVGMEKAYKQLYNQYKMLTEEQRNSSFGKAMAGELETLSNKLNETKKGVGNFKDNIGRYSDSIIDAFKKMGGSLGALEGPLKAATKGQQAMNTAMKANPIGAVIVLIQGLIAIYNKMKSAVKENEELQMRWNEAMAVFQPLIDKIKNGIDKLATSFVQFMESVANAYGKIKEFFAGVTDFLGITKDAKKNVQETNAAYKELAKAQSELTKQTREYKKLNAKDQAEVERLREEASDTDNLVEKRQLLNEAKEKQAVIDQRNIELAEENLRILKEEAARAANDAAANERLAEAEAAVDAARATAAKNQRQYNRELKAGSTAVKNYREEAKKLYEDTLEYSKTEVQKLTEKYEKEKKLLEKYHYDTTELTKKYNKDLQKLQDEAAKTAREKANAATDYSRRMFDEAFEFYSSMENLSDIIDIRRTQETRELNAFSSMQAEIRAKADEKTLEEWGKLIAPMIEEFNAKYGEAIEFPPELTEESQRAFFTSLTTFEGKLKQKIRELDYEWDAADNADLSTHWLRLDEKAIENGLTNIDEMIALHNRLRLENEKNYWDERRKDTTLGYEAQMEAEEQYFNIIYEFYQRKLELQELDRERTMNIFADSMNMLNTLNQSVNAVSSSYEQLINSEVQSGKITQEQADKKMKAIAALEKVMLALNIAQIAADTAGGIQSIWKAYAMEKVVNAQTATASGPVAAITLATLNAKSLASAIIQTAALATNGAAQIAAATNGTISKLNALKETSDGGVSVVATPSEIRSDPYSYSRTLQTQDEIDELNNRPLWISVVDLESALGHQAKIVNETSF